MHRLAGHVVVDERLGQPLGQVRRPVARSGTRAESVSVSGPSASSATQAARRPHSSQVPSTISAARARAPPAWSSHARAADSSSYCRSTLNARTSTGLQAGELEAAQPEVHPGRVAVGRDRLDPRRVDLQPDHLEAVDLGPRAARRAPAS